MEYAINTLVTFAFFAPMALMVAANLATFRAPACAAPVVPRAALAGTQGPSGVEAANDAEILEAA